MAVGKDPSVVILQELLSIRINDHAIFTNGVPESIDRPGLKASMTIQIS